MASIGKLPVGLGHVFQLRCVLAPDKEPAMGCHAIALVKALNRCLGIAAFTCSLSKRWGTL